MRFVNNLTSDDAGEGAAAVCPDATDFVVLCLCAEWCGTCREYRNEFERLASDSPEVKFLWWDIEDNAERMGDLDVENFPTILVFRRQWILFFGTMLPQIRHLQRLLETFQGQTLEQSRDYASSSPERRSWQANPDLAELACFAQ